MRADSDWEGFNGEDEIGRGNHFSEAGFDPAARGNKETLPLEIKL
jgi:hypothetical protein